MPKNKLTDLRNHLFAQLEALRDAKPEELATEIERARAVQGISGVLIESAKVEVQFLEAIGSADGSAFLEDAKPAPQLLGNGHRGAA